LDFDALTELVKQANEKFSEARDEIGRVIVGQKKLIDRLFVGILADGHILIEGLPGLAKTMAVKCLAQTLNCNFKRIQFTPDLLPADLIGTTIYHPKESTFRVNKGPIFTNLLLADEINRAPAKVQSALLEVMQEKQVTISKETYPVGKPFMVLATQNPIEQEGTYPLPEAQTDRFMMKITIEYPRFEEEKKILKRMATFSDLPQTENILSADEVVKARGIINHIYIDEKVTDYLLKIIFATRYPKEYGIDAEGLILYGASPRAGLALTLGSKALAFLHDRAFVTPHDIKQLCYDVLRHRIRMTYEAEAEEISSDFMINRILETIPVP